MYSGAKMMQVDGVIQRVHIKMNVTSMIMSLDFAHGMRFSLIQNFECQISGCSVYNSSHPLPSPTYCHSLV